MKPCSQYSHPEYETCVGDITQSCMKSNSQYIATLNLKLAFFSLSDLLFSPEDRFDGTLNTTIMDMMGLK